MIDTVEQSELQDVELLDEIDWMASRLKILNKSGKLVPLILNDQQLLVWGWMERQIEAGLPVRIIILKARQMGISTFVEGLFFALTYLYDNLRALVTAHDEDSSTELFMMNKIFEDNIPEEERRPTDACSRREIIYSHPHHSRFRVLTAGKTSLGRGSTFHALHASEVAFWRNATKTLLSVLQSIADEPGTFVVLESTANGVGGEFHGRWKQAEEEWRQRPGRLDGYIPIFLPWFIFDEYQRTPPEGYDFGELDADELLLVEKYQLDDARLYWRRCTIADKCGGDVNLFKQEYPSFPAEAFLLSGRPAIHPDICARHRLTAEKYDRGWFEMRDDGTVELVIDNQRMGDHWRIYRKVRKNHDYAVGQDVSEGILSDPSDESSAPDSHASVVLDRVTLETAAVLESRMDVDLHSEQTHYACIYYNNAWASPEVNGVGTAAIQYYKRVNYPNTYRRENSEDAVETKECASLGWKTTSANRNLMIDDYIAAAREDPISGWMGKIIVLDDRIAEQEESFVFTASGKREHAVGCHDDLMFGLFIAYQLHIRCPRTRPQDLRPEPEPQAPCGMVGEVDPGVE